MPVIRIEAARVTYQKGATLMKTRLTLMSLALLGACVSPAPPEAEREPSASPADFAILAGDDWTGALTYRDYQPPFGDVRLDLEVRVTPTPDGADLFFHFPKEPQADGNNPLVISADGRTIDGDPVFARTEAGGVLTLVTEGPCEDDDQPAICTLTYAIAPDRLTYEKQVTFADGLKVRRNAIDVTRRAPS